MPIDYPKNFKYIECYLRHLFDISCKALDILLNMFKTFPGLVLVIVGSLRGALGELRG